MSETLTITIDRNLKDNVIAKCKQLNQPVNAIVNQLLQEFVKVPIQEDEEEPLLLAGVDEFLHNLVKNSKLSEEEPFGFGLTVREYFSLSDQEQQTLWDKAFHKELEKKDLPEVDVKPNAIPAGQKCTTKMRSSNCKQPKKR